MAERAVDVRIIVSSLRRRWWILVAVAVQGALLGMGSVYLWPPMYASSSLVLMPDKAADPDQAAEQVQTDIRVAMSDSVLGRAAKSLRPRMSVEELARHVDVTAATPQVLQFEGRAEQPARAEEISRVVADAEVIYVAESLSSLSNSMRAVLAEREKELRSSLDNVQQQIQATTARLRNEHPGGSRSAADATALAKLTATQGKITVQLQQIRSETETVQPSGGASVIQQPSPAERPGLGARFLSAMALGALLAAALTGGVIVLLARRDPRLYFRDDIADAVGSPVIASVRSRATSSVADWISLFHDYSPGTVDAWAWRRALRHLGLSELSTAPDDRNKGKGALPRSITVVTLSDDPQGLVAGPELAVYAASAGVRTHLVAAQRHETAAALWAACSRLEQDPDSLPGLSVDTRGDQKPPADLAVFLAVLDRQNPKLLDVPADTVVVLALSAGSATAEELARVAVTVDEAAERIVGIIVADPDNLDRTTGRLLQHDRLRQVPLPTRLTGSPTPRGQRGPASDPQRRQG